MLRLKREGYILLFLLPVFFFPAASQSDWTTKESEHLIIYYKQDHLTQTEISKIVEISEDAYHFVTTFLGMEPKEKTKIYLCATREEYRGFSGGYASHGEIHIICVVGDYDFCKIITENKSLGSLIAHELTHIIMNSEENYPPTFLTEGIARYVNRKYLNRDPHRESKSFAENNALIPIEKVIENIRLYYPLGVYEEGASFSAFLIDEYGLDKFKKFYFKEIENSDERYAVFKKDAEKIYGVPLSQLEEKWRESLEKHPSTNIFYEDLTSLIMKYNRMWGQYMGLTYGGMYSEKIESIFYNLEENYGKDFKEVDKRLAEIEQLINEKDEGMNIFTLVSMDLRQTNDLEKIKERFKQAASLFEDSGFMSLKKQCDDYSEAITLMQEGDILMESDPSKAKDAYLKAQEKYRKVDDPSMRGAIQGRIDEATLKAQHERITKIVIAAFITAAITGIIIIKRMRSSKK